MPPSQKFDLYATIFCFLMTMFIMLSKKTKMLLFAALGLFAGSWGILAIYKLAPYISPIAPAMSSLLAILGANLLLAAATKARRVCGELWLKAIRWTNSILVGLICVGADGIEKPSYEWLSTYVTVSEFVLMSAAMWKLYEKKSSHKAVLAMFFSVCIVYASLSVSFAAWYAINYADKPLTSPDAYRYGFALCKCVYCATFLFLVSNSAESANEPKPLAERVRAFIGEQAEKLTGVKILCPSPLPATNQ